MLPHSTVLDARDKCVDRVVAKEGGYCNDPADRGNATCFGITERVARAWGYQGAMRDMQRSMAVLIYQARYWDALQLNRITAYSLILAEELFDTAVNQGVSAAATYLQRGLNVLNNDGRLYADVPVDGRVGPMTIAAFREFMDERGDEGAKVLTAACNCLQGELYIRLAEADRGQARFAYGWLKNRVVSVLAATLLLIAPLSAHAAQLTCGPHEAMTKALAAQYHEQLVGQGIMPTGSLLEVWQEPSGKTWSVVVVQAKGKAACIIAFGTGWMNEPVGRQT